jgi:hypothetical protein
MDHIDSLWADLRRAVDARNDSAALSCVKAIRQTTRKERAASYRRTWTSRNRDKTRAYQKKRRSTTRYKEWMKQYKKNWRRKNRDKERSRQRRDYYRHLERYRAYAKKYRREHPERYRLHQRRQSALLTDGWLRGRLTAKTGLSAKDIPKAMVDAHRVVLQIKRLLREMKDGEAS